MKFNKTLKVTTLSTAILGSILFTNNVNSTTINLFHQQTGNMAERHYIVQAAKDYHKKYKHNSVKINFIPEGSYAQSVTSAATANKLPCIIKIDQPLVPRFAWSKNFRPLDGFLSSKLIKNINNNGKSIYKGKVYSLGQHDVSLTIFTKKSILKKYGIRIPTLNKPWTKEEFNAILAKIKKSGDYKYSIDMGFAQTAEWNAYAYAPILQSFGGDLINRKNFKEAEGVLNGEKGLEFAKWMSMLVKKGYTNKKPIDTLSFDKGEVALSYDGSWNLGKYKKMFGDDLLYLPPVDFGNKPAVGTGSWHYAVSTSCKHPKTTKQFLEFIFSDSQIAKFSDDTSMLPTSDSAAKKSKLFKKGKPARVLYEYSKNFGIRRPETPAYATLSSAFSKAIESLKNLEDPQDTLDRAVDTIEEDLKAHNYYK